MLYTSQVVIHQINKHLGWDWIASHGVSMFFCVDPVHCSSIDFSKINFKTGSHNIIHTFKNYFAIVFSVFSNKQFPNRPFLHLWVMNLLYVEWVIGVCVGPWTNHQWVVIYYVLNCFVRGVVGEFIFYHMN